MIRGIDVSAHNGTIDWDTVAKQDIHFALAKATEGATFHDPTFAHNYAEIHRVGLLRGSYCFARPRTSTAIQEADAYVAAVKAAGGFDHFPPVLDMEDSGGLSNADLIVWIRTWMARVYQLTGRQGILYTYSAFIRDHGLTGLSELPLWIADYSGNAPYIGDWKQWTMHQFTQNGVVEGVNGNVDINNFNGSQDDLNKLCNAAQTPVVKRPSVNPGGPVSTYPPDIESGWSGYVDACKWAYDKGYLGHFGDGTFKPQDPLTREQFAYALFKLQGGK